MNNSFAFLTASGKVTKDIFIREDTDESSPVMFRVVGGIGYR